MRRRVIRVLACVVAVVSSSCGGGLPARWGDQPSDLHLAASQGDVAEIERLIAEGADPNFVGEGTVTPLMIAVEYRHGDAVAALLAAGARIDGEESLFVRLAWSTRPEDEEQALSVVQALVDGGADACVRDMGGSHDGELASDIARSRGAQVLTAALEVVESDCR